MSTGNNASTRAETWQSAGIVPKLMSATEPPGRVAHPAGRSGWRNTLLVKVLEFERVSAHVVGNQHEPSKFPGVKHDG